ncbi:MAG: SIS domain-containing protein [Candidatus Nanopelagicales bacterium]
MADDLLLDDVTAMLAADPGGMLQATASSGSQIRTGIRQTDAATIAEIVAAGTPRAIIVTGMGGSGISGQIIAALANTHSAIPVVSHRGYLLPAWVGGRDLVIALSASGRTEETIAAAAEAARRGCAVVGITAHGSPLAGVIAGSRNAWHIPVDVQGRMPRASLWTLLTPLLLMGHALGVCNADDASLHTAADIADDMSKRCGVHVPVLENPAKQLGLQFAESLPMVWGTGEVGPVASYRAISQLAENAKLPAIHGEIPESQHNQVVVFDGPFASGNSLDDLFRDREQDAPRSFRLVVLRDSVEHPQMARRAQIVEQIASRRQVPVTEVAAEGQHIVHRLASLITLTDWASVYAAIALHIDPTPIGPIDELKLRLAASAGQA